MFRPLILAAGLVGLPALTATAQDQPEMIAPGVVSTPRDELNFAIAPGGGEAYFTVKAPDGKTATIRVTRQSGGKWGQPETAPFSGRYTDFDPAVAPDGRRLFFSSNRPRPDGSHPAGDFDIWYVDRQGDGWGEPQRLAGPVNTDRPEYYPAVGSDGTLYFSADRPGGRGGFDLWRSRLVGGAYQEPENLGPAINGPGDEVDQWVAPDQSVIVFAAYDRSTSLGGGDLYISDIGGGKWTEARNLGAPINSGAREYCPIGSPDGHWFYWTSKRERFDLPSGRPGSEDLRKQLDGVLNGNGNIYRIPMAALRRGR